MEMTMAQSAEERQFHEDVLVIIWPIDL